MKSHLIWKCKCGKIMNFREKRMHLRNCSYYKKLNTCFLAGDVYTIINTDQRNMLIEVINFSTGINNNDIEKAIKYADNLVQSRLK